MRSKPGPALPGAPPATMRSVSAVGVIPARYAPKGGTAPLLPGMVLNIEVSVTDEANTYYHLGDLLVVTETGHRLLARGLAPPEIPCISEATVV